MRRLAFVLVAVLSCGVALYAVGMYALRPLGAGVHPLLREAFLEHPVAVYLHVFGAAVAMGLGPFQFVRGLRARRPEVHRWLGRLYLGLGVLVGGLAGLALAVHAFGGLAGRLGFGGLAVAWLATGAGAWRAIRSGDVAAHRRFMVRNFALTFAAVTLRLYLPLAVVSGVGFERAYPAIAWLCWVPNLLAAEWFLRRRA